jgi:hypothetical protein
VKPGRFVVACCVAGSVVLAALPAVAGALCAAAPGGRVLLESASVDPSVFVWDSRLRLVDYAAGQWGSTRAVVAHTLLAQPGTPAAVIACVAGAAHPKYALGDEDAVGVRLLGGPYRGRFGWVLSSDIHVPRPSGESAVLNVPR